MNDVLSSILHATLVHTGYTLICVAIGFVLGVSIGIGLSRLPTLSRYLLPLLSILNTVPGIVFIGLLFIYLGLTPATVIIALSIYAMFPVLKNTVTGLNGVDQQYKEAVEALRSGAFDYLVFLSGRDTPGRIDRIVRTEEMADEDSGTGAHHPGGDLAGAVGGLRA